jgi:hypothetical protein
MIRTVKRMKGMRLMRRNMIMRRTKRMMVVIIMLRMRKTLRWKDSVMNPLRMWKYFDVQVKLSMMNLTKPVVITSLESQDRMLRKH